MTFYLMVFLFMLAFASAVSAQDEDLDGEQLSTNPVCQFESRTSDNVRVYEKPDQNSAIIGSFNSNVVYEADGLIRLVNEAWLIVTEYASNTGELGFIWRGDVSITDCASVVIPGVTWPTPESLNGAPLLAYTSDRTGNTKVYLWDGEKSVNISAVRGERASQPVWNAFGELAWTAYNEEGDFNVLYIWDGSQTIKLSHLIADDLQIRGDPVWSADGRLAFEARNSQESEIYVWDGKQTINISQSAANDRQPAWSADGRLAWTSEREIDSEIYVWDGKQTINISQNPTGDDGSPSWSADGGLLSWGGIVNDNLELLVWDGERIINVSNHGAWDAWDVWSPDGRLAWVSDRNGYGAVYVWDGETIEFVSEVGEDAANLAWSPDGHLAWQSESGGFYRIHIWDGEKLKHFPYTPYAANYSPMWGKNGWLAWIIDVGFDWDVYVSNGEEIINVSDSEGIDRNHVWAP